jgi:hypothetical protein
MSDTVRFNAALERLLAPPADLLIELDASFAETPRRLARMRQEGLEREAVLEAKRLARQDEEIAKLSERHRTFRHHLDQARARRGL